MLQRCQGLSESALAAIADLEARTVAADGGRLKLEWGVLHGRDSSQIQDLLWWDGDRLVGFLGLYGFGAPTVELAGMVDPAHRRRGIGTALHDAARPLTAAGGYTKVLLVCPRAGESGARFARHLGGELDHSEHALVLNGAPADAPADPATVLRVATADDAPDVARLLQEGFGYAPPDMVAGLADDQRGTNLVVVRSGTTVGYLRLTRHDGQGGVYGFVIDAALRGHGIGRDVLRRACQRLLADGAHRVGLEVEVDNEHALGLYTSLGFVRVTTEDYFRLPSDT